MLSVLIGDAIEQLRTLPAESVQCCVTSPPYWGLRDYGTASWEGGDDGCDHIMPVSYLSSTLGASTGGRSPETHARSIGAQATPYAHDCGKCGAKRIDSQLGLEKTPEEYVAKMVEVFREVRRVLRKDGTLWLNLGDSYARAGGWSDNSGLDGLARGESGRAKSNIGNGISQQLAAGLKEKDLCGIPWRVAFALQADGWWLRSDIIWAKPNPMPESVSDRPTKSHEYLFLLTKSANYFYDAEAIKERGELRPPSYFGGKKGRDNTLPKSDPNYRNGHEQYGRLYEYDSSRNKRSVWTVATAPYPEAHFATYPPDLIKPCIMAGSRIGDTVLDPFAGSGTTGMVALELGRKAVMIELNPKYCDLIRQRCNVTPGLQLA